VRTAALAELGKLDDDADDSEPDGLNNDLGYVISTWQEHRLHDAYPEAGGYNDQDPGLVQHDWGVLNMRFNYWLNWLKDSDDDDALDFDDDAPDWREL